MVSLFGRKQEFNPYKDNDPDDMVWMLYIKGKTRRPFQKWLERCLPSKVNRLDGFGWISVIRPMECDADNETNLEGLFEAWDKHLASDNKVNYEVIEKLAKEYNVLSGKWLLFPSTGGKVDHIWSLISTGIIENDLACHSAKVSTYEDRGSHVICIYNPDFTDKQQVMASEQDIRNMGIKGKLLYKPDVYSYLDIYSGNKWKVKPNIWISNFDVKLHKSVIERSA